MKKTWKITIIIAIILIVGLVTVIEGRERLTQLRYEKEIDDLELNVEALKTSTMAMGVCFEDFFNCKGEHDCI